MHVSMQTGSINYGISVIYIAYNIIHLHKCIGFVRVNEIRNSVGTE